MSYNATNCMYIYSFIRIGKGFFFVNTFEGKFANFVVMVLLAFEQSFAAALKIKLCVYLVRIVLCEKKYSLLYLLKLNSMGLKA